jgi:hypothetical protein
MRNKQKRPAIGGLGNHPNRRTSREKRRRAQPAKPSRLITPNPAARVTPIGRPVKPWGPRAEAQLGRRILGQGR